MRHLLITSIVAATLVFGLSVQVVAETTVEDAFKYRKNIMEAMGGHAGALSMALRGLAGSAESAARHAEAMSGLGTEIGSIFQEGSDVEDSEALPEIWEEPEEFAEAVAKAEEALAVLKVAANDNDVQALGRAFRNVGKACKGCHERFREEHDH